MDEPSNDDTAIKKKSAVTPVFQSLLGKRAEIISLEKNPLSKFIESEFKRQECFNYQPDENSPFSEENQEHPPCWCGDYYRNHIQFNFEEKHSGENWDEFIADKFKPTNAYGQIEFVDTPDSQLNFCQYVRLNTNTEREKIAELLIHHWKIIPEERDVIFLLFIGSIEDKTNTNFNDAFEEMLFCLANTVNLVVAVEGDDNMLTQTLGQMLLRVRAKMVLSKEDILPPVFLGFLHWGNIFNKECLIAPGKRVKYTAANKPSNSLRSTISPFLSHAIFYDVNRISLKKREIIENVNYFQTHMNDNYPRIFSTNLLWGGSREMHFQINSSINISLIACEGTGGLADVFAKAQSYPEIKQDDKQHGFDRYKSSLMTLIEAVPGNFDANTVYNKLKARCCNNVHNFVLNSRSTQAMIDLISDACKVTINKDIDLMGFCVIWNKKDAFKALVNRSTQINSETQSVKEYFLRALAANRYKFVNSFMQLELFLEKQLTLGDLHRLYNNCVGTEDFYELLNRSGISQSISTNDKVQTLNLEDTNMEVLSDVSRIHAEKSKKFQIKKNLKKKTVHGEIYMFQIVLYLCEVFGHVYLPEYMKDLVSLSDYKENMDEKLKHPMWDLFIWAVLMNWKEMAIKLIKHTPSSMHMSVLASSIYKYNIRYVPLYDSETRRVYEEGSAYFEDLAIDILDVCGSDDQEAAIGLLLQPMPRLNGLQTLWIAALHKNVMFCSQPMCVEVVERQFNRGIRSNSFIVFLSFLFPFLLQINRIQQWGRGEEESYEHGMADKTFLQRIAVFYTSPAVKHYVYFIEYSIFLYLLCYALLFNLPITGFGTEEAIAVGFYAIGLLIVLMDLVSVSLLQGIKSTLRTAMANSFFTYNIITYLLTWLYIFLRACNFVGFTGLRELMAVLLIVCFVRMLEFLSFYRTFGPYVVVMQGMLTEFVSFLLIIAIVLIPYGISLQKLLFPNVKEWDFGSFFRIFESPYYSLYGELSLDDIRGKRENCPDNPDGIECPVFNFMTQVLQFLFMCFGTILLLNLLIAVFSAVYVQLWENSSNLWKFRRVPICEEYKFKSPIPEPFSVFHVAFKLVMDIKSFCNNREESMKNFYEYLQSVHQDVNEMAFEMKCLKKVFANRYDEQLESADYCIIQASEALKESVDEYIQSLETLKRNIEEEDRVHNELRKTETIDRTEEMEEMDQRFLDIICKANDKLRGLPEQINMLRTSLE